MLSGKDIVVEQWAIHESKGAGCEVHIEIELRRRLGCARCLYVDSGALAMYHDSMQPDYGIQIEGYAIINDWLRNNRCKQATEVFTRGTDAKES